MLRRDRGREGREGKKWLAGWLTPLLRSLQVLAALMPHSPPAAMQARAPPADTVLQGQPRSAGSRSAGLAARRLLLGFGCRLGDLDGRAAAGCLRPGKGRAAGHVMGSMAQQAKKGRQRGGCG